MWQESENNLFNVSSLICNNVDLFAIKCCHIVLSLFRQTTRESSKSKHLPVQFNGSNRTEAEFQQLSSCLLPYKAINLYTSSHFEEIMWCCLYRVNQQQQPIQRPSQSPATEFPTTGKFPSLSGLDGSSVWTLSLLMGFTSPLLRFLFQKHMLQLQFH